MNNTVCHGLLLSVFFAASTIYAGANAPGVDVTVKQRPSGKIVKQLKTDSGGNFAIGSLPPGAYTLEFRSKRPMDVKNKQFSIAIAGTKASGKQNVAGDSLVGGIALNVDVGPGANVSGQIAAGPNVAEKKKMVWIPRKIGSNLPGHWAEEGSSDALEAKTQGTLSRDKVQQMQSTAQGHGGG